MPRVYYDTNGQVTEIVDSDLEQHVPREPSWRVIVVDRAAWLTMAKNGFENHFVQASAPDSPTIAGAATIATTAADDGTLVDLRQKQRVNLSADRSEIATVDEENGDPGDIAMITHSAPEPVKLWAGVGNLDPIPGPIAGLCRGPQPIRGLITGYLTIALTHPKYFAEPISVLVKPRVGEQSQSQT